MSSWIITKLKTKNMTVLYSYEWKEGFCHEVSLMKHRRMTYYLVLVSNGVHYIADATYRVDSLNDAVKVFKREIKKMRGTA